MQVRVLLECAHWKLLENWSGVVVGGRTLCPVCPNAQTRVVVKAEDVMP